MDNHRPHRGKYPDELRVRVVRMVLDHQDEYASQWEAICSVADKLGPEAETVRLWVQWLRRIGVSGRVRPAGSLWS